MSLDELKKFALSMQQELIRCKGREPTNPNGIREEKLKELLSERERWKKQQQMLQRNLEEAQA